MRVDSFHTDSDIEDGNHRDPQTKCVANLKSWAGGKKRSDAYSTCSTYSSTAHTEAVAQADGQLVHHHFYVMFDVRTLSKHSTVSETLLWNRNFLPFPYEYPASGPTSLLLPPSPPQAHWRSLDRHTLTSPSRSY